MVGPRLNTPYDGLPHIFAPSEFRIQSSSTCDIQYSINQSNCIYIALFPWRSIALGHELIKQMCFKSTPESCERSRVSKRRRKRVPEIGTRVGERAFRGRPLIMSTIFRQFVTPSTLSTTVKLSVTPQQNYVKQILPLPPKKPTKQLTIFYTGCFLC